MPDHYKQYAPGSKKYKKAYGEHLMQKLKKKRKKGTDYPGEPHVSGAGGYGGGES